MPLNDPIPSSATDVFKRNVEDTDRLLNTSANVVNRVGTTLESFPNATGRVSDAADAAQVAIQADVDEAEAAKVAAFASYTQWSSRGDWATATAYAKGDIWNDTTTSTWYLVLNDYTSGATVNDDINGANVTVLQGAKYSTFEGLSDAVAFITAHPELFEDYSAIKTSSNRTKSECDLAGISYPDGSGADYIITSGLVADGGLVVDAGAKQLKVVTQKLDIPVDTISDLRNLEPAVDGQQVSLLGHTVAGIGGGVFYYDASDTMSADNNGTIIVTGGGKRWKRKLDGFVTPEMFGSINTDYSVGFQAALDAGYKNIYMTEGTKVFSFPIIIHDKAGLVIEGAGEDLTVLTSDGTMLLDTSRIAEIGTLDPLDYVNVNAFFLITEYDGENQRFGFAARNHLFKGFSVDLIGKTGERTIDIVTAPNLGHTKWHNVKGVGTKSVYYGFYNIDGSGAHYHLEWNNCRSTLAEHHVYNDLANSATGLLRGTTWLLRDNSLSFCRKGYEILGVAYSTLDNCSVDHTYKGSYAIYGLEANALTIINPGVEVRLEQGNPNTGCGLMKLVNSNANMIGGFFVGGDRNAIGSTGTIADYDDGSGTVVDSLLVLDNSILTSDHLVGDWQVGVSQSNPYPWFCINDSVLRYTQGKTKSGNRLLDFDVNDNSVVLNNQRTGESVKILSSGDSTIPYQQTGTFTPTVHDDDSGSGNTATVASANGEYVVTGNEVTLYIQLSGIDTTGMVSGNPIAIRDLPFTPKSSLGLIRSGSDLIMDRVSFTGNPVIVATDDQDSLRLFEINSGTLQTRMLVSSITSGSANIIFSIAYQI